MIYIGIDPGKGGAVAIHKGTNWEVYDCPTVKMRVGKSVKDVSSPELMASILHPLAIYDQPVHVFLEKVHAMPRQGSTSMFTFGSNYGSWLGIIAAMQFKLTLVTPQLWRKEMMQGMGKDKDASRLRALQLFPELRDQLARKGDDGRAEALLIGEYGRKRA